MKLVYVPINKISAYLSKGYRIVSRFEQSPHHATHAVIMERRIGRA